VRPSRYERRAALLDATSRVGLEGVAKERFKAVPAA
jgi:hypothetical protein